MIEKYYKEMDFEMISRPSSYKKTINVTLWFSSY